jgi:hypothetical protein
VDSWRGIRGYQSIDGRCIYISNEWKAILTKMEQSTRDMVEENKAGIWILGRMFSDSLEETDGDYIVDFERKEEKGYEDEMD